MKGYLIRLDDACETMNSRNWNKMEKLLDKYKIKPIVGIIPNNQCKHLILQEKDKKFWEKSIEWQNKGWTIALHGYDHVYLTNEGGINPIHERSEFAGLSLKLQKEKLKKGIKIFQEKGLIPKLFFAPSHTFDLNTIKALLEETEIRVISDTFTLKPYKFNNINFVPQQFGRARNFSIGLITFCYHPNIMIEEEFEELEKFLEKNFKKFISYDQINLRDLNKMEISDLLINKLYFLFRKIKGKLKK